MPAGAKKIEYVVKGSPNMPAGAKKFKYFVKGLP